MLDAGCSDQAIDRTGLDAVDSTPLDNVNNGEERLVRTTEIR